MGQKWYNWSPQRSQHEVNQEFLSLMHQDSGFSLQEGTQFEWEFLRLEYGQPRRIPVDWEYDPRWLDYGGEPPIPPGAFDA